MRFVLQLAVALAVSALPRLSSAAEPAPWERGSIYQLSSSNTPGTATPGPPTALQVLTELDGDAPTSFTGVVLGASQMMYAMNRQSGTNLPPDQKTLEQEQSFALMIRDVDRMTKEGRAEEAIEMLKQQLNKPMPPQQRAKINNRIAAYYFRMQRYTEALPYMREAVRLDPVDYKTLCNLSAVLMSMGELNEARFFLRTLDASKIVEPRLLFCVFFNRACLASLNNDLGLALDDLWNAAKTDPQSTLASLGDPHLDGIRPSLKFYDLRVRLESIITPIAPVTADGAP